MAPFPSTESSHGLLHSLEIRPLEAQGGRSRGLDTVHLTLPPGRRGCEGSGQNYGGCRARLGCRHTERLDGVRGMGSRGEHSWGHRVWRIWGQRDGAVGLVEGHHLCLRAQEGQGAGWREERMQPCPRGATRSPAIAHTRVVSLVFTPLLPHWTHLATLRLPGTECIPSSPGRPLVGKVARGHQGHGF